MNLNLMVRDVRPSGFFLHYQEGALVPPGPLLVTVENCNVFARIAPALAYGSAVVFSDLTEDDVRVVQAIAEANDFAAWQPAGLDRGEHCWIKRHGCESAYGSHLPYLLAAVKATTGSVLELGCGEGSTAQLHEEVVLKGRRLVSIDNNQEWLVKFEREYQGPKHDFVRADDPASTVWPNEPWSVVFVDHAPGETRAKAIERARHRAEFIVVHDTETHSYGSYEVLETFKWVQHFKYTRPWTSVASMTRRCWPNSSPLGPDPDRGWPR